jgi:hypothetical protein
MARKYQTPFLQVVYNNRGWKAPKFSRSPSTPTATPAAPPTSTWLRSPPDYAAIAVAAGGAQATRSAIPASEDAIAERCVVSEGQAALSSTSGCRRWTAPTAWRRRTAPQRSGRHLQPMASGTPLGYSLIQNHLAETNGGSSRSAFR